MVVVTPKWGTVSNRDTHSFDEGCDDDPGDAAGAGEDAMVSLMGSSRLRETTGDVLQACGTAQHTTACLRAEKKNEPQVAQCGPTTAITASQSDLNYTTRCHRHWTCRAPTTATSVTQQHLTTLTSWTSEITSFSHLAKPCRREETKACAS